MKSIGVVRQIDNLGRLVLPKELRKKMDIKIKDPMEIFVDDDQIILKKYNPGCILCEQADHVIKFKGKKICKDCIEKLT